MKQKIELTKKTYKKNIKNGVSILFYWAPWCGPCRMVLPIVEDLEENFKNNLNVKIFKINTDKEFVLAELNKVHSAPTVLILKDGKELKRFVGFKENLKETILDNIN